ncbi:MAG: HAMP domain-containing sensor histidine kinase [Gammaproteobacteria bacterium]
MTFWPFAQGLSLRLSLLLFLVLPLIAALSLIGYLSLQRLERDTELRMQEDIELIARTLRGPVEYSLELGRAGSVAQALATTFQFDRVYGAYVYDGQGRRIAASGAQAPALRGRHLSELAAGSDHISEYQETAGKQVYSYFVPLTDSIGRNTGLLQVTRDGSDIKDYIAGVQIQALALLVLLALVLFAIVVYGHHHVFGRNLRRLVSSMARIGEGDTTHRAALTGPREIRMLAQGMNDMLDNIEQSRAQLNQQQRQKRELEQQLQQSQKMAAIGQLAAGVAHELGTPLSVVSGKAQRMLRKAELPAPVAEVFGEIREAVQRMELIVRQLLDFGRSNRLRLRPHTLDSIADCALAHVRDEAQHKAVQVTTEGPGVAPRMQADAVRMEQALTNLLRNAIQATGQGGNIALQWFVQEDSVGFQVADDGPGIPGELRNRLCEPFFTTKSVGEGTGLGLSVVQSVVRDHGGQLEIGESQSGGALFVMRFPLQHGYEDGG